MTDAEIIAQLKKEPFAELRRMQKMPYEWKVEHAKDIRPVQDEVVWK